MFAFIQHFCFKCKLIDLDKTKTKNNNQKNSLQKRIISIIICFKKIIFVVVLS